MTIILRDTQDALDFLNRTDGETLIDSVILSGQLAQIDIKIDGRRYNSSVPGEVARGIWGLQEALYKAAAFALTGSDDIRRLSAQQRQRLELVFEVSEGSTDLLAKLEGFFDALGEGFKTMDDAHKFKLLVVIAVLITSYLTISNLMEGYVAQQGQLIEAQTQQVAHEQENERLRIIRDMVRTEPTVSRFDQAMDFGVRAIARGAQDATQLQLGQTTLDSDQIQYINQRASRVPSTAVTVTETFAVHQADVRSHESTRYMLGRADGTEFNVTVNHADFSPEELQALWAAARDRTRIALEVTITKNRDDIRGAQIISLIGP